jgi:hypothetical protein
VVRVPCAVLAHDPVLEKNTKDGETWEGLTRDVNEANNWALPVAKVMAKVYSLCRKMRDGKGRLTSGQGAPTSGDRSPLTPIEKALLPVFQKREQGAVLALRDIQWSISYNQINL